MTPQGKICVGLVATIVVAAAAHMLNRAPMLSDLGSRSADVMALNGIKDGRTNWVSTGGWTSRVARISGTADAAARSRTLAGVAALDGIHDAVWVDDPRMSGLASAKLPDCRRRVAEIIAARPIGFYAGGSDLAPGTAATLEALALALETCPAARIEVVGHTAPAGTPLISLSLSQARAEAVAKDLGRRGIDMRRIEPIGLGTTQNDVLDRIEFRIRPATATRALAETAS